MHLPKHLQQCVYFAKWCERHKMCPVLTAELRVLVDRRIRYWAKHDMKHSPKIREQLEAKFQEAGVTNVDYATGVVLKFTAPDGSNDVTLPTV